MNLQRKLSIVKKDKQMQSYEKFTPDAVQSHEKLRSPLYYKWVNNSQVLLIKCNSLTDNQ